MSKNKLEKLDSFLAAYCKENKIMGSFRITCRDKILYEHFIGYVDVENKIPIKENSIFSFYSLSKPFCAIGLLKLKDKGLVDIDKHPGVYVPQMQGFDERVTIRHMLHHISGLSDFEQTKEFADKYRIGPPDKLREQMRFLSEYPMFFTPGNGGMYANVNFVSLALIIENVSGLSYADYMKKEIFEPLGMKTAQVDHEGLVIANRVKGYELDGNEFVNVDRSLDWMLGAGDIIGTLDDVYCLNKAIKHKELLKSETWKEILTPSPINGMGMGCTVSDWHGKRRITHNGGHRGFRTLHIQLPEDDFDLIILSNCGFGNARNDIAEVVYQTYYGEENQPGEQIEMDKGYI